MNNQYGGFNKNFLSRFLTKKNLPKPIGIENNNIKNNHNNTINSNLINTNRIKSPHFSLQNVQTSINNNSSNKNILKPNQIKVNPTLPINTNIIASPKKTIPNFHFHTKKFSPIFNGNKLATKKYHNNKHFNCNIKIKQDNTQNVSKHKNDSTSRTPSFIKPIKNLPSNKSNDLFSTLFTNANNKDFPNKSLLKNSMNHTTRDFNNIQRIKQIRRNNQNNSKPYTPYKNKSLKNSMNSLDKQPKPRQIKSIQIFPGNYNQKKQPTRNINNIREKKPNSRPLSCRSSRVLNSNPIYKTTPYQNKVKKIQTTRKTNSNRSTELKSLMPPKNNLIKVVNQKQEYESEPLNNFYNPKMMELSESNSEKENKKEMNGVFQSENLSINYSNNKTNERRLRTTESERVVQMEFLKNRYKDLLTQFHFNVE